MTATIEVNGRGYRIPQRPVVVICFDGFDPSYLADAAPRGLMPRLVRMMAGGFAATATSAMPSFTNPNNVSIVCGAPPRVHGISGNYWFDRETGRDVMMTDAGPIAAPTILAGLGEAGVAVAAVTAKDKLRRVLGLGLAGAGRSGIAFSAECADTATVGEHGLTAAEALGGRALPDPYSAELSLFVLDAGIDLVARGRARVAYLSLSDYVQHAHAPGAPEADAFLAAVDARIGRLLDLGAVVGVTADHGMTDLALADGRPNVVYLGDLLDARFGVGHARVICPITDPFVRHHGALGGFVRIHLAAGADVEAVRDHVAGLPGVWMALTREEACRRFDLPMAREGDVAVVAVKGVALGMHRGDHRLDDLAGARLRSHGGLAETPVPFVLSHPPAPEPRRAGPLANWDVFDFALNCPAAGEIAS
ncbi:phosphonoacetate hydrolase [Siculibacillus lacustris]|uniref:Phosphonoacetate hydrolase n=1 Tax=Siculibacillus lacustris TaxID=1549641 RepID=A0A4Q9VQY5_9HYPH|nr:phosphonoacetate hydrolase [Siculibacillus lacustris]TBW38255.1 phosphonoacetate hydrolase [Siculibacillus lacustris]